MSAGLAWCLFAALVLSSCATDLRETNRRLAETRLSFLENGKTTQRDVIEQLGRPSARFQRDTILTYKLRLDPDEAGAVRLSSVTGWPPPSGYSPSDLKAIFDSGEGAGEYHLVLVFGSDGLLQRYRLLKIRE